MKPFDRLLRNWRILKAGKYIRRGSRLLDIGSADGGLFERYELIFSRAVGIDSGLPEPVERRELELRQGLVPQRSLPEDEPFDVITMLAVLEHIPPAEQEAMAGAVADQRLRPAACS